MGLNLSKSEHKQRTIQFQRQNNLDSPSNKVLTTKYTWYSFFPKSILLQFLRPANLVYLISAILQSIRVISSLNPITAIAPFVFVISISLIREGYEDYKRYQKDKEINERNARCLIKGQLTNIKWEDVMVGDIISVKNNEKICADFVLLYTTQQHSLCFVQTANLDGESNLKTKFAYQQQSTTPKEKFNSLIGKITVDQPNCVLHQFSGILCLQNEQEKHLDYDNFILRETVLKNTEEVLGVVVYTGYDTKIIQNQGSIQNKMSDIQKKVNIIQGILLIVLLILCSLCSIGFNIIHNVQNKRDNLSYLKPLVQSHSVEGNFTLTLVGFIFMSSFLLLTFLIPVSLNVSIEVIKGFLGIFLSFDDKMFYAPINKGCSVNNVAIMDELGKIDYVLTDKTGTLTANQMIFKNLSIGNISFTAQNLIKSSKQLSQNSQFHQFWLGLIICQDVVCDSQTQQYQGSSPDEVCFVTFAKSIGYQFVKRMKNSLQLSIFGKKVTYELLAVLPFDMRKRMSVVVKDLQTQRVFIYTKGADSCILSKAQPYQFESEIKASINLYARQGYRTLLFSKRQISTEEYMSLQTMRKQIKALKLLPATTSLQIEQAQMQLIQKYEERLMLLGATAIQDRLQDEVPQTIARLQQAGIVVMMITGDKLETAQNIGYLANFIKQDSKVYKIHAGFTEQQMTFLVQSIIQHNSSKNDNLSVIIQGSSISTFISSTNTSFTKMLTIVSSVIFCRSTPKQKAQIVKYVKQKLKGTVLAVGDGGNDVGMIQVANVGVGIHGKQGNSAATSSDFGIGEFKFLDRLVLHHGRWFYYRLSYFFVYYGWKNMIMTLVIFFFMAESGFSAQVALSQPYVAIYNLLIGLVLLVYFAVLQQDINDDQHPQIFHQLPLFYKQTKQRELFSFKRYAIWTFFAVIIALWLHINTSYGFGNSDAIQPNGQVGSFSHRASIMAISLCYIILIVLIGDMKSFNLLSGVGFVGILSILLTIVFFIFESYVSIARGRCFMVFSMSSFKFWQVIFLNVGGVYAGKLTIDGIHLLYYETEVQKTIRAINSEVVRIEESEQELKVYSENVARKDRQTGVAIVSIRSILDN